MPTASMIEDSIQRRRFLTALAWPVASSELCDLMGLMPPSEEVQQAEQDEAIRRMSALAQQPAMLSHLVAAARDMLDFLDGVNGEEARLVWLVTYSMAIAILLEDLGVLDLA